MSDGNTATNSNQSIGPTDAALPTEEDMGKVRAFIDQAINAFVNASQLKGEVEELRSSISTLREQVEKVNRQNSWLDEQLVRIRGERDAAISARHKAEVDAGELYATNQGLQSQLDLAKTELGNDASLIDQLKKERDDAQYTALQLEEELAKVRSKVDKFLSLADEIAPPHEPGLSQSLPNTGTVQQVPITQSWDQPKPVEVTPEPSQ